MRIVWAVLSVVMATISVVGAGRYALVAGQNRGGSSVDPLRFAEDDAAKFARLLCDYGGVEPDNMSLLLHPDSASLMAAGKIMVDMMCHRSDTSQTIMFFYYSGHADSDGLLLDSTHCSFSALKLLLESSAAQIRIAIFDACQSGVVTALKGGTRAEPFFFDDTPRSKGEVWIASASAGEQAQESSTLKSSIFSFHLFTGLRGSADISSDRRVTVTEAYQYAYRKTLETSALSSGIIQHPVYRFNLAGEGDIILTDLSDRKGGIIVDRNCKGSFLILSRNYTDVFADFSKDEGRENFIALSPGEYVIINARGAADVGVHRFSIKDRETIRCNSRMFRPSLLPYLNAQ